MLEWRLVVHTHPYAVNALTCGSRGEQAARELFGDEALWVPYTDPGYKLAMLMAEKLKAYRAAHKGEPRIVLMQNHGLVVGADTAADIRARTDEVLRRIGSRFAEPLPVGERPVADAAVRLLPALRLLLSEPDSPKIAAVRNSALAEHFLQPENRRFVELPFMPDNIVYCKSAPLILDLGDDPEALLASFPRARDAFHGTWGYDPKILLIPGIGVVAVEDTKKSADTCLEVFEDLMKVSWLSRGFGGPRFLSAADIQFIDTWEVENYRRAVSKAASGRGRVAGKIALVTGAAQGFGRGIAEGLFREGANVVVADLNETGRTEPARGNERGSAQRGGREQGAVRGRGRHQPASLQGLARECVKAFGGLDILVSNAGVLRAGSLEEMTPESFEFVTRVNYTGYFLCVKYLCPIMKLQRRFAAGRRHRYHPDQLEVRPGRKQQELRLCRREVRRCRADPVLRSGAGGARHQGELDLPGELLRGTALVRPREGALRAVPEGGKGRPGQRPWTTCAARTSHASRWGAAAVSKMSCGQSSTSSTRSTRQARPCR